MASEGGGMKAFYRQTKRKKNSSDDGGLKPSASAGKKPSSKIAGGATHGAAGGASVGAGGPPQTAALLVHGSHYDLENEYGPEEEKLRQFDMDMRYGPCLGISRLKRWERAEAMGLKPPADIGQLLHNYPSMECLWEGRV